MSTDPRPRRTARIWLGVGTAALVGVGSAQSAEPARPAGDTSAAQPADHAGHAATPAAPNPAAAGEAGGADAGLDPRVKFFRNMGLIRGHLLVGDELIRQGRWDDALPHFHHPVEEIFALIAPTLKGQNLRPFDGALKALAQTVQAKKPDAYAGASKTVELRLTETERAMRRFASPYADVMLRSAIAMLQSAAAEYGQAIEAGRITKPVEYQDSRGFVFHAERIVDQIAADLEKKDRAALAAVRAGFADLKAAWPAPMPPDAPVRDAASVLAAVSTIELAASPLINK